MLRSSQRDNPSLRDNIQTLSVSFLQTEYRIIANPRKHLLPGVLFVLVEPRNNIFSFAYTIPRKNTCKWAGNFEMAVVMKMKKWKCILVLVVTLVVGGLLHNVYVWIPNGFTALIAPVNESLWEHTKIIFYPLLLAGFLCNRKKDPVAGAAWGLAAVGASAMMLVTAYGYHRVFEQDSFIFDIALYVVAILVGFFLAQILKRLTVDKGWQVISKIVVWGMFLFGLLRTVLFLR